jgi:hypothetical protein
MKILTSLSQTHKIYAIKYFKKVYYKIDFCNFVLLKDLFSECSFKRIIDIFLLNYTTITHFF